VDRPIRVLYLDHTARLSGGEIALLRLLRALDRSRVEPLVLLGEDGPLAGKLREAGIETTVLELSPDVREIRKGTLGAGGIRHLRKLPVLLGYARKVAKFASEQRADLIHTNSLKSDIYGAIAGRMAGLPVVWHVRDGIHTGYLPAPAVLGFRILARLLPDFVVANSASTLQSLRLRKRAPQAVVPSGIAPVEPERHRVVVYDGLSLDADNAGEPAAADSESGTDGGRTPVAGMVGRVAPWKGQDVFLEAAEMVLREGYTVRFWIIGSAMFGEEEFERTLRARAESGILKGNVEFLGFREDVQEIMCKLDILVHASRVPEPFGQVVIEGMAAGVPVIAADAGGPREIITHGVNGLLTPPGDAQALARAMTELLEDRERARALARAGQEHVRKHFSVQASAEKVEKIYHELTAGRSRPARQPADDPERNRPGPS